MSGAKSGCIPRVWRSFGQLSGWPRALFAAVLSLVLSGVGSTARADRDACLQAHEQGQLMRLRGQSAQARAALTSCAASACPRLVREDCQTLLADLDAQRTAVVFVAVDAQGRELTDVRVFANEALLSEAVDGRAVLLDPGVYALRFEAPKREPVRQALALRDGERSRVVRVQLGQVPAGEQAGAPVPAHSDDAPQPSDRRAVPVLTYTLGAPALAVLATGVGLGVAGKKEHDRLDAACGITRDCSDDDKQKGRTLYIAADVAFAVGGALAVAATTVLLVDHLRTKRDRPAPRAALAPVLRRDGAGLSLRGAF